MTRLTAAASLKNATRSVHLMETKTSRLTGVAAILFASFGCGVLSFVLLFADVFEQADARNALGAVGILSFLLTFAAGYSMSAITWNCYWLERSKRVAAEAGTRDFLESIGPIVDDSIREAVDAEFDGKEQLSVDVGSLVSRLQRDVIIKVTERAAEISQEPDLEERFAGMAR